MSKRKSAKMSPAPNLSGAEILLVRFAFLAAFGISAFLAWNSLQGGGVPGCGPESDCDKVLGSRWAYIFGMPVSLFALPVYLLAIILLFQKSLRWRVLLPLALVVLGVALWFVGLQAFALRAFCKFCLTAHVLGGVAALVLLKNNPLPANATLKFAGVAALGLGLLIVAQINSSAPGPLEIVSMRPTQTNAASTLTSSNKAPATVASAKTNGHSQVDVPDSTFSFVDGQFSVNLSKVPVAGRLDAPKKMVKLFDYTCHHCRDLHHLLKPVKAKYANELAIIYLPMPLDSNCNSVIKRTAAPHVNACEYARMAIAVFLAKRDQFELFSDFLFEPERPPALEAARAEAEKLVGKEAFAAALANPRVEEQIQADIAVYVASSQIAKRGAIPQLLFARGASIGAISKPEVLDRILFKSLGLGEPPPSSPPTNAAAVQ